MSNVVSLDEYEPVKAIDMPVEGNEPLQGRADVPPPNVWQTGVVATHKATRRKAGVHRIDLITRQFRAYWLDTKVLDGRTDWQACGDFDVDVTFTAKEVERQAARALLDEQVMALDAKDLALVSVLCDDADPVKGLAKLEALRAAGMIKGAPEVMAAALENAKPKEKK